MPSTDQSKKMPVGLKLFIMSLLMFIPGVLLGFLASAFADYLDIAIGFYQMLLGLVSVAFIFAGSLYYRSDYCARLSSVQVGFTSFVALVITMMLPLTWGGALGLYIIMTLFFTVYYYVTTLAAEAILLSLKASAQTMVHAASDKTSLAEVLALFEPLEPLRKCHPDAPNVLDTAKKKAENRYFENKKTV